MNPITPAQKDHAINQMIRLESYTKVAAVALALLLTAPFVFNALGLWGITSMWLPHFTLVAAIVPLIALKVIEMQKQKYADLLGIPLNECLAIIRGAKLPKT